MAFFERELLGCKRNQASIHKTMTSRLFITAAAFSVVLSQAQDKSNQDIALLSNLIYQGHYLKAGSLLETMKHSSAAHDPAIQAEMYFHEGVLSFFRLGVNDAKYLFSQSLRYFEGANNPIKVAELKEWLGTCAFKTGNPFSSVALYQEAARIRNQNGLDTIPYAWNLYLTAVAMQNSWMKEKSEKLFFQSIRLINHYVSRMGYTAKGGPMSLNSIGHFQTGLVDRVDSLLDLSYDLNREIKIRDYSDDGFWLHYLNTFRGALSEKSRIESFILDERKLIDPKSSILDDISLAKNISVGSVVQFFKTIQMNKKDTKLNKRYERLMYNIEVLDKLNEDTYLANTLADDERKILYKNWQKHWIQADFILQSAKRERTSMTFALTMLIKIESPGSSRTQREKDSLQHELEWRQRSIEQTYETIVQEYLRAIQILGFDNNTLRIANYESIRECTSLETLLNTIVALGELHSQMSFYKGYLSQDPLPLAVQTFLNYDRLVEVIESHLISDEDKFLLAAIARSKRLTSLQVFWKSEHWDEAFYLSEKCKASLLNNDISFKTQKVFQGGSLEQREELQRLKKLILKLNDEIVLNDRKDFHDSLREATQKYNTLMQEVYQSANNPEGKSKIVSLPDLQKSLAEGEAIVSFIATFDQILWLFITKSEVNGDIVNKTYEEFSRNIKGMRNGIVYNNDVVYSESAHWLYQRLFRKLKREKISSLIILPDAELFTVPFEALLTKKVNKDDRGKYETYPYLIKEYPISYHYSATLFHLSRLNGFRLNPKENRVAAFAPIFQKTDIESLALRDTLKQINLLDSTATRAVIRNGFVTPLPHTEHEVNALKNIFANQNKTLDFYFNEQASEEKFKEIIKMPWSIVHLATHAFVDFDNIQHSGILFATDNKEDGILYSNEISDMSLQTKLFVLSACETGLGRFQSGEGVIGLTRSLLLAKVPNILCSYWKVADESTALLMIDFYKGLAVSTDGRISDDLRSAKLKMIEQMKFSNPYHWAPFVLIGR